MLMDIGQAKAVCGARKDPPDIRDHLAVLGERASMIHRPDGVVEGTGTGALPRAFSRRHEMTPIMNQNNRGQGHLGTCVACSLVNGMQEWFDLKEEGRHIDLCINELYWRCKQTDGYPDEEGTFIRAGMKCLKEYGVPIESYWRYTSNRPRPKQDPEQTYKIKGYARINAKSIEQLKRAIYQTSVVPASVKVFWPEWRNPSDVIADDSGKYIGNHAIVFVGWDELDNLIFPNSWGAGWGDGGYAKMSARYFLDNGFDAWIGYDAENMFAPPRPKTWLEILIDILRRGFVG